MHTMYIMQYINIFVRLFVYICIDSIKCRVAIDVLLDLCMGDWVRLKICKLTAMCS